MNSAPPQAIDKLVRMANQIAREFCALSPDSAAADTADHIRKFWTPKMRRDLAGYAATEGGALDLTTRKALELLSA